MTTSTTQANPSESRALLFLRFLLVALFLVTGVGKLLGLDGPREMFEGYGYTQEFRIVIGVLETAGALGMLVGPLTLWAALGLVGIMLGAIVTHLLHDPWYQAVIPLVVSVLLVRVAWAQPLCARWRGRSAGTSSPA